MAETLPCPACHAAQVRRGVPLCGSCTRAAGHVAPRPAWTLDSPLLRRALADANLPGVLAIVRAACGLSQQDMAAVTGWSRATLSCYERGRRDGVFDIRVLLQFADTAGMPRASLLALILADPDATTAIGVPVQVAGLPSATCPGRPDVGSARLRYWRACIDALHERGRQAGSAAMLQPGLLLWQQTRAACTAPGRIACPDLIGTAVEAGLYASGVALTAGSLALAHQLHAAATELAADTRDPLLSAQVLLAGSRLHAETARGAGTCKLACEALHLARQAADDARYLPFPQLHALIATREAIAASLLTDQHAFTTAINRAHRELTRTRPSSGDPAPAWLRHFGHADVTEAETAGLTALGAVGTRDHLASAPA
jgi:transcriptional regulator with XRE-family HTH domain